MKKINYLLFVTMLLFALVACNEELTNEVETNSPKVELDGTWTLQKDSKLFHVGSFDTTPAEKYLGTIVQFRFDTAKKEAFFRYRFPMGIVSEKQCNEFEILEGKKQIVKLRYASEGMPAFKVPAYNYEFTFSVEQDKDDANAIKINFLEMKNNEEKVVIDNSFGERIFIKGENEPKLGDYNHVSWLN